MRMIIPHNTVLTAGVSEVCAPGSPSPRPSEGLFTHSGTPGGRGWGYTVGANVQ